MALWIKSLPSWLHHTCNLFYVSRYRFLQQHQKDKIGYLHRACVGILLDHFMVRGQNGQILSTKLYYIKIVREVKFQLSLNTERKI